MFDLLLSCRKTLNQQKDFDDIKSQTGFVGINRIHADHKTDTILLCSKYSEQDSNPQPFTSERTYYSIS